MECEICHRAPSGRKPFNCTLCARTYVYQPRIDLAISLLQNESVEKELVQRVGDAQTSQVLAPSKKTQEDTSAWTVQQASADQVRAEEKTDKILSHVKALREEIQHMKLDIAKRKAVTVRRRKDLSAAKGDLSKSLSTGLEPVEKDIKRTLQRWEILRQQTVEQRLLHCAQAARLYSLQQHKRRKGAGGKDLYSIGFVPVPDLRELNNAPPPQITTSLTHVANLVHLLSHHLSLRLPAEIILPHSGLPQATILSPNVSYTTNQLAFPGSNLAQSSHVSPTASPVPPRITPRPRPLYVEKKLSCLAKDDPLTYAYLVEGITLLAWDVAWLCKTQGLDVGGGCWEEVCAMGKNLWQLLVGPSARRPAPRHTSSHGSVEKPPNSTEPAEASTPKSNRGAKEPPPTGFFSHGTAHGFLAAAPGNEYMREWRLQNPVKVIDKVKAMLLAERTGAEWELLEGNEWEEGEAEEQTGGATSDRLHATGEETGILVKAGVDDGRATEDGDRGGRLEDEKGKGRSSGWMKLKNR